MRQAEDFREESRVLAACIARQPQEIYGMQTQFKGWTVEDVLGHLHFFNAAAAAALEGPSAFHTMMGPALERLDAGQSILSLQRPWLNGLGGAALFEAWMQGSEQLADAFAQADPKSRVCWVGPDMSALSAVTARQMETWAHGQAIFDLLGAMRPESDRIRNIVHLGVVTFGWSFQVRGQEVPPVPPQVRLEAPSGEVWSWNAPDEANRIEGQAVEFAQVVTQVRNLADTGLRVTGATAGAWMAQAQCFAGPPETPPAPGTRYAMVGQGQRGV